MSIYCTYNTIYTGDKLPPFYIGYSLVEKVKNGYHGTVSSRKYKKIWKEELANNPHLFETTIIAVYETQSEAVEAERTLLESVQAHKNPLYINLCIGSRRFYTPIKFTNKNMILEYHREYYYKNREKRRAYWREYYQRNKELRENITPRLFSP